MPERNNSSNGEEETPLDQAALENALKAHHLGGMPPVMEFLIAEDRLKTFEALLGALDDAGHWNNAGNFEIESTNISRSVAIMGTHPLNPHPTGHVSVTAGSIIGLLKPVIEEVLLEAQVKEEAAEDPLKDRDSSDNAQILAA